MTWRIYAVMCVAVILIGILAAIIIPESPAP